ncbi:MAG: hypothetical protein CSA95_04730 [Bacteroidetes bacterium]|nr:MAG: hypothetical protein CSA95_04730 [Bacteroidota bacterium]PIE87962.1 MAG: hypothetical protein CSA04_04355 [Bacteroidota bacterium]
MEKDKERKEEKSGQAKVKNYDDKRKLENRLNWFSPTKSHTLVLSKQNYEEKFQNRLNFGVDFGKVGN